MSELLEDSPTTRIVYELRQGGIVGDWLVLGPLLLPALEPKSTYDAAARLQALRSQLALVEEITQVPSERSICTVTMGNDATQEAMWRVVNTLEDGRVDLAAQVATPHMMLAWGYAQIALPERITTTLYLDACGPIQVRINDEIVFRSDEYPTQPTLLSFTATLNAGINEVMIRAAAMGQGDVPLAIALRIADAEEGTVALPTLLEPVRRRQKLESVMDQAYLSQDVYARDQRIVLCWPKNMEQVDALTVRLQTPTGRIYAEASPMIQKGAQVDFGKAQQFPDGLYEVLLQPQYEEYYVQNMRVQRRLPLQVRNGEWSTLYYGSDAERRQEALEDAASREDDIFAEIAKSALGKWADVQHDLIEQIFAQISQRALGYERSLLALLGWLARMGDLPDFPQEVEGALAKYVPLVLGRWGDAEDAIPDVMLAACHLLAGQLYPELSFADLQLGRWHQARAEQELLRWLQATAQMGLPQGESQEVYADALIVLSHLVDLAHADEVAEMAAVVLDKLAYQLALQSFLGVWGGSQDAPHAQNPFNGRLGPLCGVFRLWWGQGAFNDESAAVVALACAESYALPEIIAAVGVDRQQDSWLRRQDLRAGASLSRVNRSAYRTGDYLIASAQGDWHAGTASQLWQVTLGPDAIVFGNRPAYSSNHAAWQTGYWRGNGALVRVAQWQDVLIVAYGRADDASVDPTLNFSHAYFPVALFDEVQFVNGWAMAREGNGYVALTATGGVELVTSGRTAEREVRAAAESLWLVQMGRAARDGTFAQFVAKVLSQPLTLAIDRLHYQSTAEQAMVFERDVPLEESLLVEGVAQSFEDFPHLESLYGGAAALPATSVEIAYLEHRMRLDFTVQEAAANI